MDEEEEGTDGIDLLTAHSSSSSFGLASSAIIQQPLSPPENLPLRFRMPRLGFLSESNTFTGLSLSSTGIFSPLKALESSVSHRSELALPSALREEENSPIFASSSSSSSSRLCETSSSARLCMTLDLISSMPLAMACLQCMLFLSLAALDCCSPPQTLTVAGLTDAAGVDDDEVDIPISYSISSSSNDVSADFFPVLAPGTWCRPGGGHRASSSMSLSEEKELCWRCDARPTGSGVASYRRPSGVSSWPRLTHQWFSTSVRVARLAGDTVSMWRIRPAAPAQHTHVYTECSLNWWVWHGIKIMT